MPSRRACWKLLVALGFAIAACGGAASPPKGDVAGALALRTLDGGHFDATALRGKACIVTFWRPGCPYCAKALPKIQAAAKKSGATAVSVMTTGKNSDGLKELARLGWSTTDGVALVDSADLWKRWDVSGVPYTLIVRPDGTAARVIQGDSAEIDDYAAAVASARQ